MAGRAGSIAPVSFRVNPDVDPRTHPYISTGLKESKFGVAWTEAPALYRRAAAMPNIVVHGIDCHIGSQVTDLTVYVEAAEKIFALVDRIEADGIALAHVDLGGGLGIRYRSEETIDPYQYALAVQRARGARKHRLLLEPGRFLVGNAGVLLTRVLYLKPGDARDFAIVDAAMNDLIRPALYDAWHDVEAVRPRDDAPRRWQIVGPDLRKRGFPRARPRPRACRGRPARRALGGCLRVRDELQLQLPTARLRSRSSTGSTCISPARERRSPNSSRANPCSRSAARMRDITRMRNRMEMRASRPDSRVRNRNSHACKARNWCGNLAIRKNLARIHAAGGMDLSRGRGKLRYRKTEPKPPAKKVKHHNSYSNSDRRLKNG